MQQRKNKELYLRESLNTTNLSCIISRIRVALSRLYHTLYTGVSESYTFRSRFASESESFLEDKVVLRLPN